MTREIMSEWLLQLDRKTGIRKRTIILLVNIFLPHNAGFKKNEPTSTEFEPDDIPLSKLSGLSAHEIGITNDLETEDFIGLDENVLTQDDNIDTQRMIEVEEEEKE
ncbi:hypothetical protein FQR65_LT13248 [Abscondita terminalis]|nr:hypothetical protein FQR65_LT13248 [Abscondita terminalis]